METLEVQPSIQNSSHFGEMYVESRGLNNTRGSLVVPMGHAPSTYQEDTTPAQNLVPAAASPPGLPTPSDSTPDPLAHGSHELASNSAPLDSPTAA